MKPFRGKPEEPERSRRQIQPSRRSWRPVGVHRDGRARGHGSPWPCPCGRPVDGPCPRPEACTSAAVGRRDPSGAGLGPARADRGGTRAIASLPSRTGGVCGRCAARPSGRVACTRDPAGRPTADERQASAFNASRARGKWARGERARPPGRARRRPDLVPVPRPRRCWPRDTPRTAGRLRQRRFSFGHSQDPS